MKNFATYFNLNIKRDNPLFETKSNFLLEKADICVNKELLVARLKPLKKFKLAINTDNNNSPRASFTARTPFSNKNPFSPKNSFATMSPTLA